MFWERLLSGIVLLAIIIATMATGGYVLFGLILLISLIGMWELYRVLQLEKTVPAMLGYAACAAYFGLVLFGNETVLFALALGFLLLLMAVYVIGYPRYKIGQIMGVFFGLFYVAMMLGCLYRVRILEGGAYLVWLAFVGSWGSDTCAYAVGRLIGKHKAFPVLSPKKSWEGCVGGVVGAGLIGFLYATVFKEQLSMLSNPQLVFAAIGAVSAVISQIGDLAASAIKREFGIKDYAKLIPGHGGILDRFDSVIFTAPIVYYLALLFIR